MDIFTDIFKSQIISILIKNKIYRYYIIVISLAQFITDISSEQSVYMSLPYLAPAIFIIGAVLLFVGTFKLSEIEHLLFAKS